MQLTTKISLPSQLDQGQTYPVIYLLHGMGSNEKDIFDLFKTLREQFILIAIRGPLERGRGFAYFDILRIGYPEPDSFEDILVKLEAVTKEAAMLYPIDRDRQFFAGFSQGAILSMSMVIRYGAQFKGIAALHGYIPQHVSAEKVADLQQVEAFIANGERDEMFSIAVAKANEAFFKDRSPLVTFKMYPHGHWVSATERDDVLAWFERFVPNLT